MANYLGDFRLGDTFDTAFTTRQISGAPFTLGSTPVISAYPANSTTELTAGITLSVDFDSRTGLNHVRVVATGGNGYATATDYQLVITTGTVNSVSVVGEVIGEFSIEHRSALMPTTAARTAVVDASGLIDANAVKVGPTGSGTAQTAGDIFAKVTGLTFTVANQVDVNVKDWAGAAVASAAAGIPKVDVDTIKTNPVVNGGTITFPTTATLASTTNITAGTIATVTNLTNAATAGDFTATMKTSLNNATPVVTVSGDLSATMKTSVQTAADAAITANALVLEIEADTDTLTAGCTLTSGERNSVADALLARNIAGGSSAGRIVSEALYVLRNKVSMAAGIVYGTDDTTTAWTFTATTDVTALPITVIDPA